MFVKERVNIITITFIAYINNNIKLENIAKYIKLSEDNIISCKYKTKKTYIYRNVNPKIITSNGSFNNQVTFVINIGNTNINVKLFNNGKLQLTGCKNTDDCKKATNSLLQEIINCSKKMNNIMFFDDINTLKISDIQPCMINSKFNINLEFDRNKTVNLLRKQQRINLVRYNPSNYPGIVVKYKTLFNSLLTFLIFQSGKIMIMSAKCENDIIEGHEYLNNLLTNNYSEIIKTEYKKYI